MAGASVFERLSLEELTRNSSHVVTARCVEIESRWNGDGSTIDTRAEFQVEKVIRGELENERISVHLPGGTVDGVSAVVVGAPRLRQADEVLLMLERRKPVEGGISAPRGEAAFSVVGLCQGVFALKPDSRTKEMRALSKALDVFSTPTAEDDDLPPGGTEGLRLDDLERRIREVG